MPVVDKVLSWRSSGLVVESGGSTVRDVHQVRVSLAEFEDPRVAIYSSGLLPRRGDSHPNVSGVVCASVSIEADEGPCIYVQRSVYRPISSTNPESADPTTVPPVWRFYPVKSQDVFEVDRNGLPVANSAGEPFDPQPLQTLLDVGLDYSLAVPASLVDPFYMIGYTLRTNDDEFLGFAAGTVLLDEVTADYVPAVSPVPAYYRLSYRFLFRQPYAGVDAGFSWFRRLLDRGRRELVGSELRVIKDELGYPFPMPSLLDGAGARLAPAAAPVWGYFREYDWADFDALGVVI